MQVCFWKANRDWFHDCFMLYFRGVFMVVLGVLEAVSTGFRQHFSELILVIFPVDFRGFQGLISSWVWRCFRLLFGAILVVFSGRFLAVLQLFGTDFLLHFLT